MKASLRMRLSAREKNKALWTRSGAIDCVEGDC